MLVHDKPSGVKTSEYLRVIMVGITATVTWSYDYVVSKWQFENDLNEISDTNFCQNKKIL